MRMPTQHEEEIQALRAALETAHQHNASLLSENRLLKAERDLFKERLAAYVRKLFAAKSEARSTDQKDLFFNEAEALAPAGTPVGDEQADVEDGVEIAAHKRAKRGRKPIDPNLPREIVRVELPENERVCPHDGAALVEIGTQASEQYHVIPQQVHVLRTERVKYACPCCDQGLRLAPAPARIVPKGILSEATMAWVITAKYQDALPLYRQAALLARFGGELSRNTLAANVVAYGLAIQPLINLLRDELFERDVILGDETEVQVLKEPGRAAQRKSYMWAQASGNGPPIRLFAYAPTRSTAFALQLYAGIRPGTVLMSDGYDAYESVAHDYELEHLGCWTHARRGFIKALDALPKAARTEEQPAAKFISAIKKLYAIEERARGLEPGQRLAMRQHDSLPVVEHIEELLLAHLHAVAPQSELGKALHYLSGQWPKLIRCFARGDVPIDNNDSENAIRPFVVGRKNWLFSDTVDGAKASANLYSLIETAKANGVEPYYYLRYVFARLPLAKTADDYATLLPWRVVITDPDK
jgi:transposase